MGYRSDVAIGIAFKDRETAQRFVATAIVAYPLAQEELSYYEVVVHNGFVVLTMYAESIKWYDGFPDVDIHDTMMNLAHEQFGAAWRFVRIGEDNTDTVDVTSLPSDYGLHETLYDLITLTRAVTCQGGERLENL
jgi:hypothetical protein